MPRPTDTTEWASTAGRRLEPTEPEKDSGFNEGTRTPARKANWIVGLLADWAAYLEEIFDANDEHQYPAPKARVRTLSAFQLQSHGAGWRTTEVGLSPNNAFVLESDANLAELVFGIGDLLPEGAVITRVRVLVKPGGSEGSAGNGMALALYTSTWDYVTLGMSYAEIAFDETLGSSFIWLDTGVISETTSKQRVGDIHTEHHLHVRASVDGGSVRDRVHRIEITYDDPGLQNI